MAKKLDLHELLELLPAISEIWDDAAAGAKKAGKRVAKEAKNPVGEIKRSAERLLEITHKSLMLGILILLTARIFVPYEIAHPVWMVAFLLLTAVTFSLFGFIIGLWATDFQKLQIIPLMVMTPLTFLGGAFYSIDMLPDDPRNVLVAISPFGGDPFTRVDRMDVYSGRRHTVATVPVNQARFVTDHQGEVRFAVGSRSDNLSQLYYRANRGADWELLNHQGTSGRIEDPVIVAGARREIVEQRLDPARPPLGSRVDEMRRADAGEISVSGSAALVGSEAAVNGPTQRTVS